MKLFIVAVVAVSSFVFNEGLAEEWAGSDAIFHQRFIPADEATELQQNTLEWRVQRCLLGQDNDWFVEFSLVGHEDPAMESFVLRDGNQPIYVEGQGWIPTTGFDIDDFCRSHTS